MDESNAVKEAQLALTDAEIELNNAHSAIDVERRNHRVLPLTDARWQNAIANYNRARRAVVQAIAHDKRH